ncbi:hypothetical protein [Maridesulfovibrio sp.]|uniref:hypothetical protein n=1 Tax=Maridesulfovibrio sp. TaxID=2795000 RepID=UPI0029CA5DED|nr:hypothetical protein [Maridesulfovibrio sp.]
MSGLVVIFGVIIWILCVWQSMRLAKKRGSSPFLILFFLLLTGFGGPLGLLAIYIFLPDRSRA